MVMLGCLYEELENIPADDLNEAAKQAAWFLDGGPFVQTEQMVTAKNQKIKLLRVMGKEILVLRV